MLLLLYFLMSRFGSYFLLSAHFKIVILAIHSVDANTTLQFHVIFFRFLLFLFLFAFFFIFYFDSLSPNIIFTLQCFTVWVIHSMNGLKTQFIGIPFSFAFRVTINHCNDVLSTLIFESIFSYIKNILSFSWYQWKISMKIIIIPLRIEQTYLYFFTFFPGKVKILFFWIENEMVNGKYIFWL